MSDGIISGIVPGIRPGIRAGLKEGIHTWPFSASQLRMAFGNYGTWASAWQCDETTGNLTDVFGGVNLTAVGTPRYRQSGQYQYDKAVGFDDNTGDGFRAANNTIYNLDATTSLAIYTCFKYDSTPSNRFLISKISFGDGYGLLAPGGDGQICAYVDGAVGAIVIYATGDHRGSSYHDALMIIDRTSQRLQLFTDINTVAEADISGVTTLSNAVLFAIGASGGGTTCGWQCAYAAIATGDIVNLRANGAAAISNIRKYTGR